MEPKRREKTEGPMGKPTDEIKQQLPNPKARAALLEQIKAKADSAAGPDREHLEAIHKIVKSAGHIDNVDKLKGELTNRMDESNRKMGSGHTVVFEEIDMRALQQARDRHKKMLELVEKHFK